MLLESLSVLRSEVQAPVDGGVAQLVRAFGSYPKCRWFESDRRYQLSNVKETLQTTPRPELFQGRGAVFCIPFRLGIKNTSGHSVDGMRALGSETDTTTLRDEN